METLRRLRIVWTVLCLLGFVGLAISWHGGLQTNLFLPAAAAALVAAFSLYPESDLLKFSLLWISGTFVAYADQIAKLYSTAPYVGNPKIVGVTILSIGGYLAVVAALWVLTPLFKRKSDQDEEAA